MAGGRRTILLVEDELSITEPVAAALERDGFDTRLAGTVEEALEQARTPVGAGSRPARRDASGRLRLRRLP
jgi:ActR/RegA family two-component response regulator